MGLYMDMKHHRQLLKNNICRIIDMIMCPGVLFACQKRSVEVIYDPQL